MHMITGIIEEVLLFPLGSGEELASYFIKGVIMLNLHPQFSHASYLTTSYQCLIVTELVDWSVCEHNSDLYHVACCPPPPPPPPPIILRDWPGEQASPD